MWFVYAYTLIQREKELEKEKFEREKRLKEQVPTNGGDREDEDQLLTEQRQEFERLKILEQEKIAQRKKQAGEESEDIPLNEMGYKEPDVPPPPYQEADRYPSVPGPRRPVPSVPDRSLKPAPSAPPPEESVSSQQRRNPPSVDRSAKPSHLTDVGQVTGNSFNLRTVHVPSRLQERFLDLAKDNTRKSLETGGFLFGCIKQNEFHITLLVIPKQVGHTDSFMDLSGDDELIAIQDKYSVIQLGWIHTHPTQTAFLSSVDLHQQYSFQSMLPESVAIVCSPKYDETAIFFLTPDHGLNEIRNCHEKSFHHHPQTNLFQACPHVKFDLSSDVIVEDLR